MPLSLARSVQPCSTYLPYARVTAQLRSQRKPTSVFGVTPIWRDLICPSQSGFLELL